MDSEIKENQREVPKVKYTMNWTHFSRNERKPKGPINSNSNKFLFVVEN